jgi:N-acetylneuraminic acid mutarotase
MLFVPEWTAQHWTSRSEHYPEEGPVRYRLLLPSLLTLGALGFAACGEQTTEPSTAGGQPTAPQLAVTSNTWLTRRDMPLELIEQAAAVVPNAAGQSILYAIGGGLADSPKPGALIPVGEVRAYNVATNTWTTKRDMPVSRWGMNGAGVIGGKIYVTGGYTKAGEYYGATASLFVYNPASDTWTRKRDMPAAGGGGVTGVIRGQLYVVTLNYSANQVIRFFRYDPTKDSWTPLPNPTVPPNVGGGVINNKLYLTGGEQNRVLEYDPITNHWTQKRAWTSQSCVPGFACNVSGATAVMLAHLYVIGGYSAGLSNGTGIFVYDPVSNTWESKPLLTTFGYWDVGRLTAARVYLNGQPRVEMIGGYRPGNNQQYIP